MSSPLKHLAARVLRPAAGLVGRISDPLRRVWAHARLASRIHGEVPDSVVILGVPEIHGTGKITLGEDLYLYRELYLETRDEGSIEIGADVVLSRGVHVASFAGVTIGAGAMIGEYASIRDASHRRVPGQAIRHSGHDSAPIKIGRNAWIGRAVIVLPGVTIGDGAVVGANAVVSHDVAEGALVAGVPARPIERRNAA